MIKIRYIVLVFLFLACAKKLPPEKQAYYDKGKSLYIKHCITCHNPNPSRPGASGPPLKNASTELVYKKVLFGSYPDGYKPKMPGRLMKVFKGELNKSDTDAISIYLQNL